MNIIGIIPARFASTRFPGKPLVEINGKTMIRRVYEQAAKSSDLTDVYVATDDQRIFDHVLGFGGQAMMTSDTHRTGTERCHEVVRKLETENKFFDVAINIQGDEPYIQPDQIDLLASCFTNPDIEIATLIKKLNSGEELNSPNTIKVVTAKNGQALYFSRAQIPFVRGKENAQWLQFNTFYKHIGIYAYRTVTLKAITALQPCPLETAESLEQLRWLENGYHIFTRETCHESYSVDAPEDLLKFNNFAD
ncbi:MAG TPA: 3-deoxy-manno-octulosonate cytidylyltransferase [Bacteroidales bacterium]|nr:3-deoxy-manno-octulosonate cytidylyltransferase [Bacteroidales bacterium]HQI70532.1 3-deoxy-manno-octulosonate cytidylyltransferase [Bacteroidales bacterium]